MSQTILTRLRPTGAGIDSVVARTHFPGHEIVTVGNGADDSVKIAYVKPLVSQTPIRVPRDERPPNCSALTM